MPNIDYSPNLHLFHLVTYLPFSARNDLIARFFIAIIAEIGIKRLYPIFFTVLQSAMVGNNGFIGSYLVEMS